MKIKLSLSSYWFLVIILAIYPYNFMNKTYKECVRECVEKIIYDYCL